jgi:hypothetical protein
LDALFEAHPDSKNLSIEGLLMRYIDAIDFDLKMIFSSS